jgi:uncharacterized Zn-finger protein
MSSQTEADALEADPGQHGESSADKEQTMSQAEADALAADSGDDQPPARILILPDRSMRCSACAKLFTHRGTANRHLLKHSGHRDYPCSSCTAAFQTRAVLRQHELSHADLKPFACDHCPATFRAAANLAVHTRIHLQERPYACPDCPRTFRDTSNRNRHHLRAHKMKPNDCLCPKLCGKIFASKHACDQHQHTCQGQNLGLRNQLVDAPQALSTAALRIGHKIITKQFV